MTLLTDYRGLNVLITGDTGFKGSWLTIWLYKLGANITGVGLEPKTSRDNYCVCDVGSLITHYNCDIRKYNKLKEIFLKSKPDFVFHLAAQALVTDSYDNPRVTFEINTQGTINILDIIRQTPSVQAGIMVTSDKCYENKGWIYPYREIDSFGGYDPYSASKGAAEIAISSYVRSFFSKNESPTISSVRAGNVIGGGDWAKNRIVPDYIRSIEENKPLLIRNPYAIRPWQHVLEPLYGYLLLGTKMLNEGHEFQGGWNFGPFYQNHVPVIELINKFIEKTGRGLVKIVGNSNLLCETQVLKLDISKAMHYLGWTPKLNIDEVIQLTLNEYNINQKTKDFVLNQRMEHIEDYLNIQKK